MTIRHLRIFQAVCENGTTTAAASALHLSQPSISTAIKEMEESYGVVFFDRIGNRLCLTSTGEKLLQYAAQLLSLFEQMENEIKSAETHSVLRVGSSITIASCRLPGLIKNLKSRYPQLRTEVWVGNSGEVSQRVIDNQLDIGMIESVPNDENLFGEQFSHDELVFLCSPENPLAHKTDVAPSVLADKPFLLREDGSAARELVAALLMSATGVEPHIVWKSSSNQVIVKAAKAGLGIAVLPNILVQHEVRKGELSTFTVAGISPKRPYYIIRHKHKHMTAPMKELWSSCVDDKDSG